MTVLRTTMPTIRSEITDFMSRTFVTTSSKFLLVLLRHTGSIMFSDLESRDPCQTLFQLLLLFVLLLCHRYRKDKWYSI